MEFVEREDSIKEELQFYKSFSLTDTAHLSTTVKVILMAGMADAQLGFATFNVVK